MRDGALAFWCIIFVIWILRTPVNLKNAGKITRFAFWFLVVSVGIITIGFLFG